MKWSSVDVNFLSALGQSAGEPGRRVILTKLRPGELVDLIVQEARGFHRVEVDVLKRRRAELVQTGEGEEERSPEELSDADRTLLGQLDVLLQTHQAAIEDLDPEHVQGLLAAFDRAGPDKKEALQAESEDGIVVELNPEGYGLTGDLATRRAHLGLEGEADW